MLGKEGSATLRDFWDFINSVTNAHAEGREFTSCSILLERLSKEAMEYNLSREMVERDEKRREALERLWSASKARRHMDQTQGPNQENYTGEQFGEADEMVDEAMEALDALSPTPQDPE